MEVKLNPNKKVVSEVKKRLKETSGYCPCAIVHSEDTKCMCKAFRDQVARGEEGECHCGLYVATNELPEEHEDTEEHINNTKKNESLEANLWHCEAPQNIVGKIVRIKDDVKTLLGGKAIPDWVRSSELFISRENENGTVMLAFSDSLIDYDILFKKDIVITDNERTFSDSEPLLDAIDVRIMGVPSRIDNIRTTQRRLNIPDENIMIDYNHEGCLKTAMRAWSKPTDKEFVMVLQDDIELCDNFARCCNKIVTAHPDKIITLFQFLIKSNVNMKKMCSPYVSLGHGYASGQGIIMRSEWITDCLSGWETSGIKGDDTNINAWAERTGREIITTIPAILQHIGEQSVYEPGRVLGKSTLYRKDAAKKANWDNTFITSWTNIIR